MFNYYEFKDGENITILELLKPDGTSLGELKNAYNRVSKLSLGEVSELSFNLPNFENIFNIIEDADNTIGAPDINEKDISKASITLVGYQVKATYSNGLEMIFLLPNKKITSDTKKTEISFTCYSREYELARTLILNYQGVLIDDIYILDGITLEEAVRDLFGGTFWTIGFLDVGYNSSDENAMKRTVEAFNNVSLLSVTDSLCNTFGAIPIYDTVNRTVSFYRADNTTYFKYNGLLIDDSNYLTNIEQTNSSDELITRLYGLGANDLTINGINPTGVSYIEDLSYFLYPATLNEAKTDILTSSKYMSDGLALAELLYEDKVITTGVSFALLYADKDIKNKELIVLENSLTTLNFDLDIIKDYIDVTFVGTNTAIESNTAYVAKRDELDAQQDLVDSKQAEIDAKEAEIAAIDSQLQILYDELKMESNFTTEQLEERQCFIYEGLYTNTGISIVEDLYDEMVEFINSKKEPSIIITTGMNSLFSIKSKNANTEKNKINIGEQIDIYYNFRGIDIDIRAQILNLTIDEENNTMEVIISNTKDYKRNSADYLEGILKRSITTSTVVNNNIIDWNKGKIAVDELDNLYKQGIDAAEIQINSASDNSVVTNERGLTIINTLEPLRFMRATNGVIALTKDGGRTYSTAITPEGIWAERLIGQIILGSELYIESSDVNTSLQIKDIPTGTFLDKDSAGNDYADDFGIVVKSSTHNIFVSKQRGFKITSSTGTNLFIAKTDGNLKCVGLEVENGIFNGSITSNSGAIGGWNILTTGISKGTTDATSKGMLSGDTIAFYAGHLTPASAPFKVNQNGALYASNANISGTISATAGTIGGWNIDSVQLQKTIGQYSFEIRSDRGAADPALLIYDAGAGQYNFYVRPDGFLYARNANISGTINATSGSFSGSISASSISGGSIYSASISSTMLTVTSDGSLRYYNSPGFLYCGGNTSNHPYVSALNVAHGSGALSLRDSSGRTNAGSERAHIRLDSSYNLGVTAVTNDCYVEGYHLYLHAREGYVWAGRGSGGYTRVAVDAGGPSSLCLKENLNKFTSNDYNGAYNLLKNIDLYRYDYKYNISDYDNEYGFIIDYVEENKDAEKYFYFKDEVAKDKNGDLDYKEGYDHPDDDDTIHFKRFDVEVLCKYLFTVCKTLQEKVDNLESKINN